MYSQGTVYLLYSILLAFALLLTLPVYFVRNKLLRGESLRLKNRLGSGLAPKENDRPSLWIHAVSVGEVLSLQNLIDRLKSGHPDWNIFFSTLTNSGYRVAREKLAQADRIFFLPFDFGPVVRKFFRFLRPSVLVLAESELWPNLLREAKKASCDVLVINGRISGRTFRRLKRVRPLVRKAFEPVDSFLVQTAQDADRLKESGIEDSRIQVAGNLKSEVRLRTLSDRETEEMKYALSLSSGNKVLVAGSTRKGEEDLLLEAFREARSRRRNVLLIIAPRHIDRAEEVDRLASEAGFSVKRKTRLKAGESWDVLVLDTIGELAKIYSVSDIAFVGGSLVPWGGHNLLEPAFFGKPVFFGPHMHNFAFLAERFIASGAARVVENRSELVDMFLMKDEQALAEMGFRGQKTLASLQGATDRAVKAIEDCMSRK